MCVVNETHCVLKRMDEWILCSKKENSEYDGVYDAKFKPDLQSKECNVPHGHVKGNKAAYTFSISI